MASAIELRFILKQKANEIASVISKVRGAEDVRAERVSGLPYLRIHLKRDALARHGLDESDVLDAIAAIGGKPVEKLLKAIVGSRCRSDSPRTSVQLQTILAICA